MDEGHQLMMKGRPSQYQTSEYWSKEAEFRVVDPDGWDRHNFEYSWYEERITREEFNRRAMRSSLILSGGMDITGQEAE